MHNAVIEVKRMFKPQQSYILIIIAEQFVVSTILVL